MRAAAIVVGVNMIDLLLVIFIFSSLRYSSASYTLCCVRCESGRLVKPSERRTAGTGGGKKYRGK